MMLALVDYIFLAFALLICLFGLFRGATREAVSLVVLILSLVLAVLFFQQFGHWLARSSHTPHWLLENVFLAMVVVLLFVGWILTALLFTLLPGPRGGYSTVFRLS